MRSDLILWTHTFLQLVLALAENSIMGHFLVHCFMCSYLFQDLTYYLHTTSTCYPSRFYTNPKKCVQISVRSTYIRTISCCYKVVIWKIWISFTRNRPSPWSAIDRQATPQLNSIHTNYCALRLLNTLRGGSSLKATGFSLFFFDVVEDMMETMSSFLFYFLL